MVTKEIKEYKKSLYNSLSLELANFERNFFIVSGAVFSYTISLLNEFIQLKGSQMLYLLFICWACLIISIALIMFAFLYSAYSSEMLNKYVNDFMLTYQLFDDNAILNSDIEIEYRKESYAKFNKYKKNLRIIRYISVIFFICGIIFLSLFVAFNLYS